MNGAMLIADRQGARGHVALPTTEEAWSVAGGPHIPAFHRQPGRLAVLAVILEEHRQERGE